MMSTERSEAKDTRGKLVASFESMGVEMHEISDVSTSGETLGAALLNDPTRLCRKPRSAGLVR
eukprot:4552767-Lingulodinium_polyedra.AAC.1